MSRFFKSLNVSQFVLLAAIAVVAALSACEKTIHISLASSPPQVVVEGAIETNLPPYVILTSTVGFFSSLNLTTLQNSFLHGATVQVYDGTNTVTLKEYTIDTGINNKFYIYSVDTTNLSNIMLGQVGRFYKLTITYNGTTYTSLTKIPAVKGVDSLWFGMPINPNYPDSALQLFANYTDPDTPGNYVQYFTAIDKQIYYPSDIFSDALVNGKVVDNIALYAGHSDSINANADSLSYFYPGDTVHVKWCEIDQGVYNFWNSEMYAQIAIGNPFSTPINLQSNITNGALGVWAGYGSVYYTLVVPE